jgi:hypothetical protein
MECNIVKPLKIVANSTAAIYQATKCCSLIHLSCYFVESTSTNMTQDIIEDSVNVLASSQRVKSGTNNSASDSIVDGVIVRNANKSYGSGKNKYKVLQDLNMTVKKGTM